MKIAQVGPGHPHGSLDRPTVPYLLRWISLPLLVVILLLAYGSSIMAQSPVASQTATAPQSATAAQSATVEQALPASEPGDLSNIMELAVTTASDWQSEADIVYNPSQDEYLVVWQDRRSGSHWDIRGRRISGTGQAIGSDIAICTSSYDQRFPKAALLHRK